VWLKEIAVLADQEDVSESIFARRHTGLNQSVSFLRACQGMMSVRSKEQGGMAGR
jgi:hypothetical protein